MRRIKWVVFIAAVALLVIIVFQNLAETEVHLLFWTVSLPQAALLTIAIATGFLMSLSANALWKVRAWRVRASAAKSEAHDKKLEGS
jgi:uncharacterized integral membrane protein